MTGETYVSRNLLASTHLLLYRFKYIKPFTRIYSYVISMSLVWTRMSFVCHSYMYSYVLVCHPYVLVCTRMSSVCHLYVFVCTRMSSVCHSYVPVCHSYVTRMWFYHEPFLTYNSGTPPFVSAVLSKGFPS